ncbi:MAG: sulfatase-like hydrolase/transferase, partial [Verrucomicrobiae bacterium]|nr:sulfatase-like hydrolase/transferase [Verrucomicrobiae bacterium]
MSFLKRFAFCFSSILMVLMLTVGCQPAKKQKTNFIFILSDDVAQGDLGSYGQELIQTPRLDQLAAEGVRFMQ